MIQKKTKERILFLQKMLSSGKTKAEIRELAEKEYGWKNDVFYDTWKAMESGDTAHKKSRDQLLRNASFKKIINEGNCYFCEQPSTLQHHVSYQPEIIICLCPKCHGKIHFVTKTQHKIIVEANEEIAKLKRNWSRMVGFVKMIEKEATL